MAERTLVWDVFEYVFEADRRQMRRIKPIRTYRNPIFLAREWKTMLGSGEYSSQTDLAGALGVSRVRVAQILRLLRLDPTVIEDYRPRRSFKLSDCNREAEAPPARSDGATGRSRLNRRKRHIIRYIR